MSETSFGFDIHTGIRWWSCWNTGDNKTNKKVQLHLRQFECFVNLSLNFLNGSWIAKTFASAMLFWTGICLHPLLNDQNKFPCNSLFLPPFKGYTSYTISSTVGFDISQYSLFSHLPLILSLPLSYNSN